MSPAKQQSGGTIMSNTPASAPATPHAINEPWLATYSEPIIEPDLPIVDPHHHLWDNRCFRYLFADLLADTSSGHNIRSTVFLQCRAMYRADGDPALAPVGETEFVNGAAAMSASGIYGPTRHCAGIVGFADLMLGAGVERVLEAHLRAAGDRFKGIRNSSVWDEDQSIVSAGRDSAGPFARQEIPRRLRQARAARPVLRRVAVPSSDSRPDRSGEGVSQHYRRAQPYRRADRPERLCRQAGSSDARLARVDCRAGENAERLLQAR